MATTYKTNRRWRDLLSLSDLPELAKKDFDYIGEVDADCARFVRYRGSWLDVFDMVALRDEADFPGWQAHKADSCFSGVIVKFNRGGSRVQVGTYFVTSDE